MQQTRIRIFYSCLIVVALTLTLALNVKAQRPAAGVPTATSGSITGKVVLPDGSFLAAAIRIRLETSRGVNASIYTESDGRFQFADLSAGTYQLVIEGDQNRFDTTVQRVEVVRGMPVLLTVILKEKKPEAKQLMNGSVSSGELNQQVPAKARKEFELATRLVEAGKTDDAIAHLRNAISIYPAYLMARNNLGAQLMDQQKFNEAETELRAALDIDKSAFNPTINLGIVLVRKHEFAEAGMLLDRATSMQPTSPAARLYHGMALMGLSLLDDAVAEMKKAYSLGGSQYAGALFYLGQLYMDKGERNLARQYLAQYLQEAPQAENAEQAQRLIGLLN